MPIFLPVRTKKEAEKIGGKTGRIVGKALGKVFLFLFL
jgi:hypothetical protein